MSEELRGVYLKDELGPKYFSTVFFCYFDVSDNFLIKHREYIDWPAYFEVIHRDISLRVIKKCSKNILKAISELGDSLIESEQAEHMREEIDNAYIDYLIDLNNKKEQF
jgi:hypothetical protein